MGYLILYMKSLLSHILISGRKAAYLFLGLFDRAIGRKKPVVTILSYHSVSNDSWKFSVSPAMIKKQISYLLTQYDVITLSDLELYFKGKKNFSRPAVVVTFDDGYKNVMTLSSFFAQKNIRPALFVLSNTKKPNWKELGTKRDFLTNKDIKILIKNGWEIGSHSNTHANLATVSPKELETEVRTAKETLEKNSGIKIKYFAYPRGKYSKEVLQVVKKAKYIFGLTMDDGFINPKSDLLTLPRVGIDQTHSFAEFKATISPTVIQCRGLVKQTFIGRYV
jgi:peptidoglycan/xylan/chitin deacetylase (PgdA/CDA1 family)